MKKELYIEAACDELLTYGLWNVKDRVKRLIKKYMLKRQVGEEDMIFWTTGLLAVGLWHCRQEIIAEKAGKTEPEVTETGELSAQETALLEKIEAALSVYFERWKKKGCPIFYLDDLLAGEVFLAVCEEYDKNQAANGMINEKNVQQYRDAVQKMADYALAYPTDETGSFFYRENQRTGHIYVDSIGLTSPFLYEYGRYYEKDEGMELAVKQIANFLAYGIDAETGLPYHGYHMASGTKYGIIGWGRAVGWLLRGMTGCMTTVYGAARLQEAYGNLIDAVICWQRKDGYFSWQLQAVEGPEDTSATAMICAALQDGLKMKRLQGEIYQIALEKGIRAIQKSTKNGRVYGCLGECEGFSQYPQKFDAYPWSLGPTLMLDEI